MPSDTANRYSQIIARVFAMNYSAGAQQVPFTRAEFMAACTALGISPPKNFGDVVYSFRYRHPLPQEVIEKQPLGLQWVIFPDGRSQYRFVAVKCASVLPRAGLSVTKILDATPGMIDRYAQGDEQALLAKLRYNRLLDIYAGITTYSLQNHLRTSIDIGGSQSQIETDEVYVGVDRHGAHYVFPVQAKGGSDNLSVVQIWQDFKLCADKFGDLICRPIAAQFMADDVIALFSFDWDGEYGITVASGSERHYKLAARNELSAEELRAYGAAASSLGGGE